VRDFLYDFTGFFLSNTTEFSRLLVFQPDKLVNTGLDSGEVGEHTAQPALIDKVHTTAFGFFYRFLRLFLVPTKNSFSLGNGFSDELQALASITAVTFQINDVNAITFGEDVVFHPRVPTTRLMTEVRSRFEELFDCCSIRQFIQPPIVY
jgi:hypothetical protein